MPRARSQNPLTKLCDESPLPIYALDGQRRIISCNPACAEWLGLPAEQLIGQRCDYAANELAPAERSAAAALCPPPQVFVGEMAQRQVVWRAPSGNLEHRTATFVPLSAEDSAAILAVLGEATLADSTAPPAMDIAQSGDLHERLQQLVRRMRARFRLDRLVGDSPAIRRVRDQVATAIASRSRVLVVGPPGSGREHIARTIIYADRPDHDPTLLPLACATLDGELLQSSLTSLSKRGQAPASSEEATLLLLEVDQMTPPVQTVLATMLRHPPFRFRVLSTARKSLMQLAADDAFDRELAFALSTLEIELPSLQDRREDIPMLLQRMVEEFNAVGGRQLAGFSPAALDRLASLPWNGNVEELSMVVREACQNVGTVWIGEADLPARVRAVVSAGLHPRREPEPIRLDDFLLEVERELIERALRRGQGNKAAAARLLGISRARLLRRLEQWGMVTRDGDEAEIDFQLIEDSPPSADSVEDSNQDDQA